MPLLLNPYFWAAQALALAIAVFGGCQWQGNREEAARADLNHKITLLDNDVAILSGTLNDVNAIKAQALRDAADQAKNAADALRQADKDRAEFDRKQAATAAALERARRDPGCATQLDMKLCAAIPLL